MSKTIILLIGIPGSGKTTYFMNHLKPEDALDCSVAYINADRIRAKMYGDENIQGDGKLVFEEVFFNFKEALENKEIKTIVVDNTNVSFKARKSFYQLIKENYKDDDYKIELVIFDNFQLAVQRNLHRKRVVPYDVMKRMIDNFELPNEWERYNCFIKYERSCFSGVVYD